MDLHAMLENSKLELTNPVASSTGPATVQPGIALALEGVMGVRERFEEFMAGTELGAFASETCPADPTRSNYCLAWVSGWAQYFASELAVGAVTGKLKETGGRHRQVALSEGLSAKLAGVAIASGLSGRVFNVAIGPPVGLHIVELASLVQKTEIGPLDGPNVAVVLKNPTASYMGRETPIGLKAMLEGGLVSAEEGCSYDGVYQNESEAVKELLKEFRTRVGFWNEMAPGVAKKGGDVRWWPAEGQDDVTCWADSDHLLKGRMIWTTKRGEVLHQILRTNLESVHMNRKQERAQKQTTR